MLFLSWTRPSDHHRKSCIDNSGDFNYNEDFRGLTRQIDGVSGATADAGESLAKHGFFINRARVLLGSGRRTYQLAKSALQSWRHFGLEWAFVEPKTPVESGVKYCVCVKEFVPWIMMPLKVAYVVFDEIPVSGRNLAGSAVSVPRPIKKGSFGFGSGTLHGHLLAGEERFSIEWDENDQVWYEIVSFSKPAHLLSVISYPYVQLRQKYFAQQSANALLKLVNKGTTA